MTPILKQVLLFSFLILLVAGTYSSFTSLLNYIHKTHGSQHIWHAQIFFVISSLACIVFNILIPNLKFNNLKQLTYIIPSSFFMIYFLTFIGFMTENNALVLICTILAAIFSGIASSSVWIVSGRYISLTCQYYQAKQLEGKYFGIFGSIMACNFFIGAIISGTALNYLDEKHNVYFFLSILAIVSVLFCKFYIKDPQTKAQLNQTTNSRQINKDQTDNLSLIEQKKKKQKWVSINFKCNKVWLLSILAVYKKMANLIPFQILNGITVGYIFHCSQDLVFAPDKQSKNTFLTITLIFVGIGSTIGAYAAGYISDRLNSKKVFTIGVISCLLCFIMGIVSLKLKIELISLLTSLVSGFGMMYTNNMLVVMCSKYYDGSMMIFGTNRQMINVSFLLYNLIINTIKPQNMQSQMYYELIVLIIISLVCLYMIRFIRDKKYTKGEQGINMQKINETVQAQINIDLVNMDSKSINEDSNRINIDTNIRQKTNNL